jgi:uncharacterized Rmd1/YagE family protein
MDPRADLRDLGPRFDVRAVNVADRIDVRGIEPRLSSHLPVMVAVGASGCATLFRSGAVVFFGVDALAQERFLHDLAPRIHGKFENPEVERAVIRVSESDSVEPDAILVRETSIERLQVVAEILAKSVVLARNEGGVGAAFSARPGNEARPQARAVETARSGPAHRRIDVG